MPKCEDGSASVTAAEEKYFQFTSETMSEDTFGEIFVGAKNRYGIAGTYFGQVDIDASFDNYLDAGERETDDLEAAETTPSVYDYATVREAVKATHTWRYLSDRIGEAVKEQVDGQVDEQVRVAIDALSDDKGRQP